MTPQEAKVIAEFLLGNLDAEIPATIRVFRAMPTDRLDYQPDPVSKTALALMRHIALEDEWLLNGVANGGFGKMPDDSDACGLMSPEDAVACYKERIPAAMARVRAMSGEDLAKEIELGGVIKMPAIQFLAMALRHSAHHRGQLTAYLRSMGGKVPSIYGPSADTMPAAV